MLLVSESGASIKYKTIGGQTSRWIFDLKGIILTVRMPKNIFPKEYERFGCH
jgi:hypothetical protein